MKRSVRNIIIGTVTALIASFCFGVGFASWSILPTGVAGINLLADTHLIGNDVKIVVGNWSGGMIQFSANATDAGNGWLTNSSASENLTSIFTLTITHSANKPIRFSEFSFLECDSSKNLLEGTNAKYTTESNRTIDQSSSVKNGLVGSVPALVAQEPTNNVRNGYISVTTPNGSSVDWTKLSDGGFEYTPAENATQSTLTFNARFCWGPGLNYLNPMDYYADLGMEYTSDFVDKMTRLRSIGTTYFLMSMTISNMEEE